MSTTLVSKRFEGLLSKILTRFPVSNPRYELLFVTVLFGFVLLSHLFHISRNSLWFDESFDLYIAKQTPFFEGLILFRPYDVHPPLFYAVAHLWMNLTGVSELAVRSFSLLMSLLTMLTVYWLVRPRLGVKIALTSLLLLAVSPLLLFWSQSARPYAWFTLLVTISMGLLLLATEQPQKKQYWIAYALVTAVLPYAHYLGLHVVFSQLVFGVLVLYKDRKALLRLGLSLVFIGLAFAPWINNFLFQAKNGPSAHIANQGPVQLLDTLMAFGSWYFPPQLLFLVALIFFPLFFAGVVSLRQIQPRLAIFLPIWTFLPVLSAWISSILRPGFSVLYMVFCLPPFVVVVATGIWWLQKHWRFAPLLLLLLTIGINVASCYRYDRNYTYQDWRTMVNYVATNQQVGDVIFLANPYGFTQGAFDFYYRYQLSSPGNLNYRFVTNEDQANEKVAEIFRSSKRVWRVTYYNENTAWMEKTIDPNIPAEYKPVYYKLYPAPVEQAPIALTLYVKDS